jgi:formylglycine-generating enzyme required for sulfatase activity
VEITRPFYLGVHPVTQEEYRSVMGKNPSHFSADGEGKKKVAGVNTDHFPVEMVSWHDAAEFCRRLSHRTEEKKAGRAYRLPTEAEWEYACRAGSRSLYSFGDDQKKLGGYAWFVENSSSMTHAVGLKEPNRWGLYDLHGNVYQWCSDWYDRDYYRQGVNRDPQGPENRSLRVLRGGSWVNYARDCRAAHRGHYDPGLRYHYCGFRVAASAGRAP